MVRFCRRVNSQARTNLCQINIISSLDRYLYEAEGYHDPIFQVNIKKHHLRLKR